MYVAELIYPGTWLNCADKKWAEDVGRMIMFLESSLTEAAVSLNLFESEQAQVFGSHREEEADQDNERHRAPFAEYEKSLGTESFYRGFREVYQMVEIDLKRENWAAGQLPKDYKHSLIFIYAKSFLHALDSIGKFLTVFSKDIPTVPAVSDAKKRFDENFKTLKGVRDSVQHIEDRGRGLDKRSQPLAQKPVDNGMIRSARGALILNNLSNNRYGCTMEDGYFGEVEVSNESLVFARDCIQVVIDAFQWHGTAQHYPS